MQQPFELLLPLALILLCSKVFSLLGKKVGLPAVVGMIIAGIALGFVRYIPGQTIFTDSAGGTLEGLSFLSKIGVVLIMFSAGIGTDLKQFKKVGLPSVVITSLGVICPLVFGFLVAAAFNGGFVNMSTHQMLSNFFYGAILAATSVSITVAALKELGKLNTKVGMSIVAAAIIDDIIGIILLSLFVGLDNSSGAGSDIGIVIGKMIGFFVAAIAVGFLIRFGVKWMSRRHPHTRRIPILCIAICFFYAFAAEKWFGVADITGAYIAGLMLAGLRESNYVDSKVETTNYLIFAPVFFANIGITANFGEINPSIVGFGFAFIAAGILGKLVGCGAGAFMCKYSLRDSVRVGLGMMVRAEVVLVCTQKGIDSGMVDPNIMPFVLILIILTTLLTPLLLKLSYRKDKPDGELLPALATADGTTAPPSGLTIPNEITFASNSEPSFDAQTQSSDNGGAQFVSDGDGYDDGDGYSDGELVISNADHFNNEDN